MGLIEENVKASLLQKVLNLSDLNCCCCGLVKVISIIASQDGIVSQASPRGTCRRERVLNIGAMCEFDHFYWHVIIVRIEILRSEAASSAGKMSILSFQKFQ